MLEIVDMNVFKTTTLPNNKTIILYSVQYIWFVKYVFLAKIWFEETSTRIVKYKSWVDKLNPDSLLLTTSSQRIFNLCSIYGSTNQRQSHRQPGKIMQESLRFDLWLKHVSLI